LTYPGLFSQLVNDISEDLLKSKKAFLLSSLLDKMFSYLPEHVPKDLTTRKLQRNLESQKACPLKLSWLILINIIVGSG
jgi:hypothetical protein